MGEALLAVFPTQFYSDEDDCHRVWEEFETNEKNATAKNKKKNEKNKKNKYGEHSW